MAKLSEPKARKVKGEMIGTISCWQEQGAWVFLLLELGGFVCVMYTTILTSELVLVL